MSIPKMMPSRTIAIGDVHGHADALQRLLGVIQPTRSDVLVFLGDYIDRGPDSKGVVDAVLGLRERCSVVCIYGNHEEMLMAARDDRAEDLFWKKFGGDKAAESYRESGMFAASKIFANNPSHADFYKSLLPYYETASHIFVHAAYNPSQGDKQGGATLRWEAYHKYPPHPTKTLICGHSPQKSFLPEFRERQICIDTGCGVLKGGRLTALNVHTLEYWQVPSSEE